MRHGSHVLVCQPDDRVWHTLRASWGTVVDLPGTEHLGIPQVEVQFDGWDDGPVLVSADLLRGEDDNTAGHSRFMTI